MLKLHVCIFWKYNLHLILRAEAFTKSHANLWAVVDFNPPRTSLLLVYYSLPFSQLLVTLVQEELSVGVLSYYSFSKETNMPHISEEETTYAAPEFVLLTTDKATRGGKWKHKWFGIMATFFRFAVCHKDAFSTFPPHPTPPIIRGHVCLNCCRNKKLPGETHSPTSPNKQAPTCWANLIAISAQTSKVTCKLEVHLPMEEKFPQTGKGSW